MLPYLKIRSVVTRVKHEFDVQIVVAGCAAGEVETKSDAPLLVPCILPCRLERYGRMFVLHDIFQDFRLWSYQLLTRVF